MRIFFILFLIISTSIGTTFDSSIFEQFEKQDKQKFNDLRKKIEKKLKNWKIDEAYELLDKMKQYITSKKDNKIIDNLWRKIYNLENELILTTFFANNKKYIIPNKKLCKSIGDGAVFYKPTDYYEAYRCFMNDDIIDGFKGAETICKKINMRIPTYKEMKELIRKYESDEYTLIKYIQMSHPKGRKGISSYGGYYIVYDGYRADVWIDKESDGHYYLYKHYRPDHGYVICIEK